MSIYDRMTSRTKSQISIVHTTGTLRRGCITVLSGEGSGRSVTVDATEKVNIGRNERECELVIPSKDISRLHCTVEYDSERCMFIMTDRSMNGVYLEGQRLPFNIPVMFASGTILYLSNRSHMIILR